MNDADLTLDGNAIAGLLQEVLPFEMTSVRVSCAGCGTVAELADAVAYTHAPGLVLRCRACQAVLLRIASNNGRYWLDLSGASCLEIRRPAPTRHDS